MSLRIALLALALIATTASVPAPARADDLADFHAAVEATMVARRALTAHLIEGERQRAMVELEGMREAWGQVSALPRPVAFEQQPYTATMLDVSTRMVAMVLVMNLGRPAVALESLEAIRTSLSKLRREAHVTVLADCIEDADTDFAALAETAEKPNFENGALPALAEAYRVTLQRCDGMAPALVRGRADFRNPIDGAIALLTDFAQAIQSRDAAQLRRTIEQLRTLNDMMARRYG